MAIKIIGGVKHYPAFNTEAHAHDFEYVRNHAQNTMWDMDHDEIPYDSKAYAELERTVEQAEAVLSRLSWPLTYLPYDLYRFAKETIGWAACARDAATQRGGEQR